jgi:hypothetical protein
METRRKMMKNRVDEGESEMLEHVWEEETRIEESDGPCGQWAQFGEEIEREDASPNLAGLRQGTVSQSEEENGNAKATIIDMIQQLTTEFRKFKKDVYGENQRITESMEEWKVDFKRKASETLSETAGELELKLNKKNRRDTEGK